MMFKRTAFQKCNYIFMRYGGNRALQFSFAILLALISALLITGIIPSKKRSPQQTLKESFVDVKDTPADSIALVYYNAWKALLEKGDSREALERAKSLIVEQPTSGAARIMVAVALLYKGEFDEATESIHEAQEQNGGRELFLQVQGILFAGIQKHFREGQASDPLLEFLVAAIDESGRSTISSWTKDHHYWIRWNAVKTLKVMGLQVDMCEVHILDLKHAGSVRTRVKAAENLGEICDRRAVSALKEAAQKGFRDPRVAVAATLALKRCNR